jgi:metal-responsive CopG/Arc/MetJ family transcriptional regulator
MMSQMMPKIRTTVSLPQELLVRIDQLIRSGRASSRNDFLAAAARRELERLRREAIDREFEEMATDELYQREARQLSDDYAVADWEALRVAESDS